MMQIVPRGREFEFSFLLSGFTDLTDEIENAVYEAGCDDALLSIRCGVPYLTFARNAASYKDAVFSAIRDVKKIGRGVEIVRIDDCNLVTQSEIAHRMGCTRQAINQYVKGDRGDGRFPSPACNITDGQSLWSWCDVASWMRQNGYLSEQAYQDARYATAINTALDFFRCRNIDREAIDEIAEVLRDG